MTISEIQQALRNLRNCTLGEFDAHIEALSKAMRGERCGITLREGEYPPLQSMCTLPPKHSGECGVPSFIEDARAIDLAPESKAKAILALKRVLTREALFERAEKIARGLDGHICGAVCDNGFGDLFHCTRLAGHNDSCCEYDLDMNVKPERYPTAVCLFLTNEEGKVLAVSRFGQPTKFGMPGGKVDKGEHARVALKREVLEETGLVVTSAKPVFMEYCKGGVDYICITYTGTVQGELHTDEPLQIAWVDKGVLLQGPFAEYDRQLFKVLGL